MSELKDLLNILPKDDDERMAEWAAWNRRVMAALAKDIEEFYFKEKVPDDPA